MTVGDSQSDLLLDTGSTTTGVAGATCGTCAKDGVSRRYAPGASAVDTGAKASASFSDGLFTWSGEVYRDALGIRGATANVSFVEIGEERNFFYTSYCRSGPSRFDGILGLGATHLLAPGTTSYLDRLAALPGWPDIFAVELCPEGGNLWLGGFDPAFTTGPVQYTPMTEADYGYTVQIADVRVDGASLVVPPNAYETTIVDTGGPDFIVPTAVFDALTTAIGSAPAFKQRFGGPAWFTDGRCTALDESSETLDALLPELTIAFDSGSTLKASASSSYLIANAGNADGDVVFCPGISTIPGWIFSIGASLLQAAVTVFDRANQRIGFAPRVACP
jgi:hypothetical protein